MGLRQRCPHCMVGHYNVAIGHRNAQRFYVSEITDCPVVILVAEIPAPYSDGHTSARHAQQQLGHLLLAFGELPSECVWVIVSPKEGNANFLMYLCYEHVR